MSAKAYGIVIDTDYDKLLTEQGAKLLRDYYMLPEENSPQEAYARAAVAFADNLDHAQRIYDYAAKQWFMFSSPILSNAPVPGKNAKALPISCFLSYVPDTLQGLVEHQSELAWLSVKGGGVGGHWSDVRALSDKSPGPIPFIKVADSAMTAYKQGTTRKGSYAAYMSCDHPDLIEFLNIRVPTGGDPNRKAFNIHNAVNVTQEFIDAVVEDKPWDLKDPSDGTVRDTLQARDIWERILETRFRTGEPYINFIDTANAALPEAQKRLGLKIHGSNLCNEIHLPTDVGRTAVCCLSSVNLEYFDEWKETSMVRDLVRFLDNVLTYFIGNAPDELHRASYSAYRERAIGLGAMGWHSYLQRNSIPWESAVALGAAHRLFSFIKNEAVAESKTLASERGECPDMLGTGLRNSHLLAIAPNANSGLICATSASIEPIKSNAYTHRTRAGAHLITNKYLKKLLQSYGKDTEETWQSIILNEGSVQHLDFLTQDERDTYKTAFELDMHWSVEQITHIQSYVCQGISFNTFFPAGASKSYVNSVHLKAARSGVVKGMYYLRTSAGKTGDKVSVKIERVALKDADDCVACQG